MRSSGTNAPNAIAAWALVLAVVATRGCAERAAEDADAPLPPPVESVPDGAMGDGNALATAGSPTDGGPEASADSGAGIRVSVVPQVGHAVHGPAGARLGSATFHMKNEGVAPVRISAQRVEFLAGHSCGRFPTEVRATPKLRGMAAGGVLVPVLVLPAGRAQTVVVEFDPVGAGQTHCNRYAFRVTFDVDGRIVTSTAETKVTRVEVRH